MAGGSLAVGGLRSMLAALQAVAGGHGWLAAAQHAAALACRPFSSSAAGLSEEPAAPQPPPQQPQPSTSKQRARPAPAAAATASGSGTAATAATATGVDPALLHAQRSRYSQYYRSILAHELLLKLPGKRKVEDLPQLRRATLTIMAMDTHVAKDTADKSELLLHLLALEHVTARRGAFIAPPSRQLADKAAGVSVTLTGDPMYDFMERLVYLVLPNQVGFEGVTHPVLVAEAQAEARRPHGPHKTSPLLSPIPERRPSVPRAARLDFFLSNMAIPNMLLFPEFERNFNLFEPLRSVRLQLEVAAGSAEEAALLLQGLALPVAPPPPPLAVAGA